MSAHLRRAVPVAILVSLLAVAGTGRAQSAARPKLLVLGIDGMSADRAERLMQEGKLPNLAALAKQGGYSRLAPSNPAQSPVSWSSLVTGTNPGKTGIYDFLRRKPAKVRSAFSPGVDIVFSYSESRDEAVVPEWARAALLFGAGAVGAAAGLGIVLSLFAGERRKKRPHGLLVGTATGLAFVFSAVGYVALGWVPAKIPFAHNLRTGDPFWVTLDKKGVRCVALEAPLSFPADTMTCGCCLSGLGTPDGAGTVGTFSVWSDEPDLPAKTETGGQAFFVEPGAASFDLVLVGPRNPRADPDAVREAYRAADVEKYLRESHNDWSPVQRRASETKQALLELADQATAHVAATVERGKAVHLTTAAGVRVDLRPGEWSGLVPVEFRLSPVVAIHERVRFRLESAGSAPKADGEPWTPLRLFVAPVQLDAAALPPNGQIASPPAFATDLARAVGAFDTMGWPELTNPVKDEAVSYRAFAEHVDVVRANRERRLMDRLGRGDWDCLFAMFSEPDRVQHALFRHVDPKSPRHDPKAAAEFGPEIDRAYTEVDRMVGDATKVAPAGTRVIVCSDHGFAPFHRGVNLNNFLVAQGFQVRSGAADHERIDKLLKGAFFKGVDWTETKAYAMGLGTLNLNLEGRETHGSVKPADAGRVLDEIEAKLYALRDADGAKVVHRVYRGAQIYHGARAAEGPDLVVGFELGYRVSWQNCLGSLDANVITDNTMRWSGDHCSVDPELVPGVLFSSMPLDPLVKPQVADVAPSVLQVFGETGVDLDGKPVFAATK